MSATIARKPAVTADIFGTKLTLNFANGEFLEIDYTKLSADIVRQATLHGLKQKLVDAAAIPWSPDNKSASITEKMDAVKEVHARLTSSTPTWNKVREVTATSTGNGLLVRALMAAMNRDKGTIERFLETKSKEEKAALRKNERVAAEILKLQAVSIDPKIDTDALLGELGGDDDNGDHDEVTKVRVEHDDSAIPSAKAKPAKVKKAA